jgi:hypothetical protein
LGQLIPGDRIGFPYHLVISPAMDESRWAISITTPELLRPEPLAAPPVHLQARLQTDITWCASGALLQDASALLEAENFDHRLPSCWRALFSSLMQAFND